MGLSSKIVFNGIEQHATGLLHLDRSIPLTINAITKTKDHPQGSFQ